MHFKKKNKILNLTFTFYVCACSCNYQMLVFLPWSHFHLKKIFPVPPFYIWRNGSKRHHLVFWKFGLCVLSVRGQKEWATKEWNMNKNPHEFCPVITTTWLLFKSAGHNNNSYLGHRLLSCINPFRELKYSFFSFRSIREHRARYSRYVILKSPICFINSAVVILPHSI